MIREIKNKLIFSAKYCAKWENFHLKLLSEKNSLISPWFPISFLFPPDILGQNKIPWYFSDLAETLNTVNE